MIDLDIKPLSVNQCWQGRRFKTQAYKSYERDLLLMLPRVDLPEPPFKINFEWGFSNSLSDWDNPIKPFQDILQKKYGFNDKDVYTARIEKKLVKKGKEYISFSIENISS